MKKLLLLFLFLVGCEQVSPLKELEKQLYELSEIYVQVSQEEFHSKLMITQNDYDSFLTLKTLIVWNQKEIFIFENPSAFLIEKLNIYKKENTRLYEIDDYVIYTSDDVEITDKIAQVLNKNQ